jgi:hypothetical protein
LEEGQLMQLGSIQLRQVLLYSRPLAQYMQTLAEIQTAQFVLLHGIHAPLKVKPTMQAVQILAAEQILQPILLQLMHEPLTE